MMILLVKVEVTMRFFLHRHAEMKELKTVVPHPLGGLKGALKSPLLADSHYG